MFVDYDPQSNKWCVFNNRGLVVASFASFEEAVRYTEQD